MLPPMAIFFPLFTILEDFGYLPRVAFNLDRCFKGCHACGKQALTTCMGFGCNAAGVVGCRIIDSERERLLAERADAAGGAYPVAVPVTDTIPALRARFAELEAGDETGVTASVAGRVVFSRNTGKLCFASLQSGDGSRIQAMVSLAEVGEDSLQAWKELVDLGDHVSVTGQVISSRRGELSIMVSS